MTFAVTPLIGVDVTDTSSLQSGSSSVYEPEFQLGGRAALSDGGETMYIKASSAITAGDVLLIDSAGAAAPITTALCDAGTATAHKYIGVAHTTLASGQHGWACTRGVPTAGISVLASCVKGSPLYTTSTAGALDDTSSSSHLISGIQITATATGAAVTAGYLSVNPVLVSGTVNNT
jgi:hypothetical protein